MQTVKTIATILAGLGGLVVLWSKFGPAAKTS